MTKIRQSIDNLSLYNGVTGTSIVDTIDAYFDRRNTHEQIHDRIKEIYGQGIKISQDPNNPDVQIETYAKTGFTKQVDAGMVPAISYGFGVKVVNALATLFSEGYDFALRNESIDDTTDALALLAEYRREAGFERQLIKADRKSVEIGSSAILVSFFADMFRYQVIKPSDIAVVFGDHIVEDGESRLVDAKDIDDASVVIIRLGQSTENPTLYNFLAIFGEQTNYEYGRWVTYLASDFRDDIPAVGSVDATDYEIGNLSPVNPLTYYRKQNPGIGGLPEYPISVFYGCVSDSDNLMPVSDALYNDSLNMDVQASRLLSTSGEEARGTIAISRTQTGANAPLPESTTGTIALSPGLEIQKLPGNSQASKDALEVLSKLSIAAAAGYAVPDYMITSEDYVFSAESGVALEVKTRPLIKSRAQRVETNRHSVRRIFEIEKTLLDLFSTSDAGLIAAITGAEQIWDAGQLQLPENKLENANRLIALKKEGIIDIILAIQEYHKLPTVDEAIAIYEEMKERESKYPDKQAQAQTQALNRQPAFGTRSRFGFENGQ